MFHRMMNYGEFEPRPSVILTRDLIKKHMPKYKRHDDLVIVQESAWDEFKKSLPMRVSKDENSPFSVDEDELAFLLCQVIPKPTCKRLAIDKGVKDDDFRTPDMEMILGVNDTVTRKENQVILEFDITKCMYCFGNIKEKLRMASLDCSNEIVVDLFAGIGYFSLQVLVHAKPKHLYACDWNEEAIKAFKKNLKLNKIDENRCTVIEGDNRTNRPVGVAQRVILGILPSCLDWMSTAFECVDKETGAILHCHELVECKPPEESPPPPATPSDQVEGTEVNEEKNVSEKDEENNVSEKEEETTPQTEETTPQTEEITPQTEEINPPTEEIKVDTTSNRLDNSSETEGTDEKKVEEQVSGVPCPEDVNDNQEKDGSTKTSSDSDKDCTPPVLLEKPTPSEYSQDRTSINLNESSSSSSNKEDSSLNESIHITDHELNAYEARAEVLMSKIKQDVESHDLKISLLYIQPVKSYAPHVNHVVFDIQIAPVGRKQETSQMTNSEG